MALNQPRRWLIAYDIRDPRRLARVHRLLTRAAVPVQYSVFAAAGSARAMRELAAAVAKKIDPRVDDVRFYPVPEQIQAYTIGATMLPEEVLLIVDRADLDPLLGHLGDRPSR
jgi:CRISPR-associated protein Cas2